MFRGCAPSNQAPAIYRKSRIYLATCTGISVRARSISSRKRDEWVTTDLTRFHLLKRDQGAEPVVDRLFQVLFAAEIAFGWVRIVSSVRWRRPTSWHFSGPSLKGLAIGSKMTLRLRSFSTCLKKCLTTCRC
jgi:hypothetical protein